MKIKLAPSMMCSNYANLKSDIDALNAAGVDLLHCDIMDGHYVPNLIAGPDYIKTLRGLGEAKVDLHLMVEQPERFVDMFDMQPGERISFHYETTRHPMRLVSQLKQKGLQVGIALAPSVPAALLEDMLEDIDFIHLMLVNPGYAGQPLVSAMTEKLKKTRALCMDRGLDMDIEVDGCVSYDNFADIVGMGATTLVLGVYSCFDAALGISAALGKIKSITSGLEQS